MPRATLSVAESAEFIEQKIGGMRQFVEIGRQQIAGHGNQTGNGNSFIAGHCGRHINRSRGCLVAV